MKSAILVVSFGAANKETAGKTMIQIEKRIAEKNPGKPVYCAWMNDRLREQINRQEGMKIPDIAQAVRQMLKDGVSEVTVYPVFMVCGKMYEEMVRCLEQYKNQLLKITVGRPLLEVEEFRRRTVHMIDQIYKAEAGKTIVLVGHGTDTESEQRYAEIGELLEDLGRSDVLLGTMKNESSFQEIIRKLRKNQETMQIGHGELRNYKVLLVPFMITAGGHVMHEIMGEGEESWKNRLRAYGYEVEGQWKGLGEYEEIQEMFSESIYPYINKGMPLYSIQEK